jgi:hypothetical protein
MKEHNKLSEDEIFKLKNTLLQLNGALLRLGINTNEVVIILPRYDFSYFKNVLESGSLAKFYIHVDDDSFKLSGITISRNKGENE